MATICSEVLAPPPDFLNTYFFPSWNSLAAGSRASETCAPGLYPAARTASRIVSSASSLDLRSGAKPPSSPTAVA